MIYNQISLMILFDIMEDFMACIPEILNDIYFNPQSLDLDTAFIQNEVLSRYQNTLDILEAELLSMGVHLV